MISRGFSILEILIAMAILLMAISAVTLMSPGLQSTAVDAQLNVEALNKAQELLENEQSLARKDFKLVNPDTATTTSGGFDTRIYATPIGLFTKKVTAIVAWTPQYGRHQEVTLSTLVSNFQNAIGGDTCSSILSGNWASPTATNLLFGTLLGDTAGTYQISDLDVYQKRVYVAMNQGNQSVGPNNPAVGLNDNTVGALGWSAPNSAISSNNSYATRTMSGNAVTNYLKVTNFGFAIPQGATILGIRVDVERSRSGGSTGEVRDSLVRIVKNGTVSTAVNRALTTTNWPTSDGTATYGGTSDLWGESWTAADINNNANFGVAIAATGSSGSTNRVANVDDITVTVTYRKQFYILNATNPTSPTAMGQLATAVTTSPVDAGFNAIAVATSTLTGGYAYVATDSSTNQLQVIDVGATTPTIVTSYHPLNSGTARANAIFFKDGYLYLGLAANASGPELYIIDVHNPLAIPALLPGNFVYEVNAGVNAIYVKNNKVYLATDDYTRELVILDVSDLAHPSLYGTYDAPPAGATTFGLGKSLYTVGDTLSMGRYYIVNAPEFAVLNTVSPVPALLGTSDVGPNAGNPYGVYGLIVRDIRTFVLTSAATGGQLRVYDTANPGSIAQIASVTLPNSGGGTALDCEGNYLYAASNPQSGSFLNRSSITVVTAP